MGINGLVNHILERPLEFAGLFAIKEVLEEWFVSNKSLNIYFVATFVTACTVLILSTKIAWRVFKDLPEPLGELKQALNFTDAMLWLFLHRFIL